ncbi:efflux RND transporter periplasmic adaptor subunit [Arthrobacter sp. HLT1-20]
MRVLRRVIFPIVWVLIFAVIAMALVKLAFVDGLKDEGEQLVPQAQIGAPVTAVNRATVTNTVELAGTVQSDAAVPVRATAAGKVVFFFVEKGAQLAAGDRIFQVRSEVVADPSAVVAPDDGGTADTAKNPPAAPAPVYAFTDVLAPVAGTLDTLSVLLNQELSVGDNAGSVSPGTFSITGTLTTAQQFRLLGKPATASGTVTNGPAPFKCNDVQLSNKKSDGGTGVGAAMIPGAMVPGAPVTPEETGTGQVSCAVPVGTAVFPGLGATITLTAGEAKDVLTLPLTAVKGSVQNGLVWVPGVDGSGAPQERKVVLGLNDGDVVEIRTGLAEGEQVLEFVPGADAVVPNGQMAGFGPMGG